jgi:hypothetical protein
MGENMPQIPVTSTLGYIGIFFLIAGAFLILAGLGIVVIQNITIKAGKQTWGFGFILALLGFFFLLPEINSSIRNNLPTPTPTLTETATSTSQVMGSVIDTPTTFDTATPNVLFPDSKYLVITEVLGNPCGSNSSNEFIELYNSSVSFVDVSDLWITDGEQSDKIVAWQSRYLSVSLGSQVKVDTTQIPPHGFAVILAPGYPFVKTDRIMPYVFPEGTIILTVADGLLLGDESDGIEVTNRDTIVLYQGTETYIENIISTYGSPIISSSPTSIKDDSLDDIPFYASPNDCWSVIRILPVNEDLETNWERVDKSSPGSGNYP